MNKAGSTTKTHPSQGASRAKVGKPQFFPLTDQSKQSTIRGRELQSAPQNIFFRNDHIYASIIDNFYLESARSVLDALPIRPVNLPRSFTPLKAQRGEVTWQGHIK